MGNDGGSIPKRRELVKEAARALTVSELKANAVESLAHAWTHDPLTTEPLDLDNVVSDWRGRLYNYEAILQGLMPSSSDDVAAATAASPPSDSQQLTFASTGIKSLRDIVKLKFHRITPPGSKTSISTCPISLKELGPATKAVYLVPCGHVFAEAAIREIHHHHHQQQQQQQQQQQKEEEKKDESACPECSEAFESRDAVPILSADVDGGDLARLSRRMDELRASGLTHSLKKDKKAGGKKKRKAEDDGKGEKREEERKTEKRRATDEAVANKGAKKEVSNRMSGINNAMAASLTAKVLAEQEELSKRRKFASSLRA